MNRFAVLKSMKMQTSEHEKAYKESIVVMRSAIEQVMQQNKTKEGSFVKALYDAQLSEEEIQATLLLMFIAGSETTSSLLTYIVCQLGNRSDLQSDLYDELKSKTDEEMREKIDQFKRITEVFKEGIRLNPSAFISGRQFSKDAKMTIMDQEGHTEIVEFYKGDSILVGPAFSARNPDRFENPDLFEPSRHRQGEGGFSWEPFGSGFHMCPGRHLAKEEIKIFLAFLSKIYTFTTKTNDPSQIGLAALKFDRDIMVSFSKREEVE